MKEAIISNQDEYQITSFTTPNHFVQHYKQYQTKALLSSFYSSSHTLEQFNPPPPPPPPTLDTRKLNPLTTT